MKRLEIRKDPKGVKRTPLGFVLVSNLFLDDTTKVITNNVGLLVITLVVSFMTKTKEVI